MNRNTRPSTRCALIAGAVLVAVGLPLLAWAQGSSSQPAKPAAAPAQQPAAAPVQQPAAAPAQQPAAAPAQQPAAAPAQKPAASAPEHRAPGMPDTSLAAARAAIGRELKMMADSLKLTKEQRDKVRPMLLDHAYQVNQLRAKYAAQPRTAATRGAMAKEMQTLREAADAKIATVLSADQMTQYKAMRDARLTKMRSRMAPPPAAAPAAAPAADTTKK